MLKEKLTKMVIHEETCIFWGSFPQIHGPWERKILDSRLLLVVDFCKIFAEVLGDWQSIFAEVKYYSERRLHLEPLEDSNKTTNIILEALKNTRQRGIIDRGSRDVFLLVDCLHDWLFPQCLAVAWDLTLRSICLKVLMSMTDIRLVDNLKSMNHAKRSVAKFRRSPRLTSPEGSVSNEKVLKRKRKNENASTSKKQKCSRLSICKPLKMLKMKSNQKKGSTSVLRSSLRSPDSRTSDEKGC